MQIDIPIKFSVEVNAYEEKSIFRYKRKGQYVATFFHSENNEYGIKHIMVNIFKNEIHICSENKRKPIRLILCHLRFT